MAAYFKDLPMSGLMKTTSRSESANAFFNMYVKSHLNLYDFLNNYDDEIERQRDEQSANENSTRTSLPWLVSPLQLEVHAAKVYNRKVFLDVQKELKKAMWFCGIEGVDVVDGSKICFVSHNNKNLASKTNYKVVYDVVSHTVDCACNFFTHNGFLCRHCFEVLINDNVEFIPARYLLRRWMRALVPPQLVSAKVRYDEVDPEKERMFTGVFSVVDDVVTSVQNDMVQFRGFYDLLWGHKRNVSAILPVDDVVQQKLDAITEHYGVEVPDDPDVFVPTGLRNKEAGIGKRLESISEKFQKRGKKPKRRCKKIWGSNWT
ncbi:hypothetical protein OSB04_001630 [Centaurea solstitialis]|uniref:SWIM-type domain-containing protein n=1 Tax=Centaurea solstitialis TaxID=347529 RepID=A0AA38TRP7_9ASTR|nr:hypothetical protein OSB04_001630 [Centaurea solstitialis]